MWNLIKSALAAYINRQSVETEYTEFVLKSNKETSERMARMEESVKNAIDNNKLVPFQNLPTGKREH
jgi:hypothetical protein